MPSRSLREALRTHAFQHDDWLDMDRGTLDEASVVRRCAARMARPESELRALFDHVRAALTPIEPTVALLRELRQRAGLKLYGLSNMSADDLRVPRRAGTISSSCSTASSCRRPSSC